MHICKLHFTISTLSAKWVIFTNRQKPIYSSANRDVIKLGKNPTLRRRKTNGRGVGSRIKGRRCRGQNKFYLLNDCKTIYIFLSLPEFKINWSQLVLDIKLRRGRCNNTNNYAILQKSKISRFLKCFLALKFYLLVLSKILQIKYQRNI